MTRCVRPVALASLLAAISPAAGQWSRPTHFHGGVGSTFRPVGLTVTAGWTTPRLFPTYGGGFYGAGTFLPVKANDTDDHKMHLEIGHVSADAAASLNAVKARGGRIVCVAAD